MAPENLNANVLNDYKKSLLTDLPKMEGKKFIVLGDVGLDEYVMGDVKRISPEAPVPVVEVDKEETRLGLAANVAANLVSLGGVSYVVGVVGEDPASERLRELLSASGVKDQLLVEDPQRPTTKKMRIMASHQQVVRVDFERRRFLDPEIEKKILSNVESIIDQTDCIIIEDYAKGVLSKSLCQAVIKLARRNSVKVIADPHRSTPIDYYVGVNLLKPNRDEAFILAGCTGDEISETGNKLLEVGKVLMKKLQSEHVIITQGKSGMMLFSDQKTTQLPTYAREVFDVTGAGDTVIAAIGLAWSSGLSLEKACVFANFAAGVVVGQVGSVPCKKSDLINYINSHQ